MESNLTDNNDLTQLEDPWFLNFKVDQYLGKVPPFSSLGDKLKNLTIRCSYRNIGEEELLIVSRADVDAVVKYYIKTFENKSFNEDYFFKFFMKRGFSKTKCFYFFNRLLTYGGYDGKGILKINNDEANNKQSSIS